MLLAALPKVDCAALKRGGGGDAPAASTTARAGEVPGGAPAPPPPAFAGAESLPDAGSLDGKTPFEQAKLLEQAGQAWRARLVLEPQALGPDGTLEEQQLLKKVCTTLNDVDCVARVDARQKGEKRPYDTAKRLYGKGKLDAARAVLDPRLASGEATAEERKLLRQICERQKDKECLKALPK